MRYCRIEVAGKPRWGIVNDDLVTLIAGPPWLGVVAGGIFVVGALSGYLADRVRKGGTQLDTARSKTRRGRASRMA